MTPELSKPTSLPPSPSVSPDPVPTARPDRRPLIGRRAALRTLPIADAAPPTALKCLKCQLLGKRQLTCSKADACAELPQTFALGPVLLAAWLATAIAFVATVYGR